jgi:hypothetical protein
MNFENRFHELISEDYDFDRGVIASSDIIYKLIDLVTDMPVNRKKRMSNGFIHFRGWCKKESTYIDFKIKKDYSMIVEAYIGSENITD